VSRPVAKIVDERAQTADNGVREITLIGQNVMPITARDFGANLAARRTAGSPRRYPGIVRLRYSTASPRCRRQPDRGASRPRLADAVRASAGASGSDRILSAMNRKHRADDYRRVIDRFRASRQDMHFHRIYRGFPGETEKISPPPSRWSRKSDTLALIRSNIRHARNAGGGHAGDGVSGGNGRAIGAAPGIDRPPASAFNRAMIGKTVDVLFERAAAIPADGRPHRLLQPAHVMASGDIIGQVLPSPSTVSSATACSANSRPP